MNVTGRVRLAIRGYANGVLQFKELVDVDPDKLDEVLPTLAKKHIDALTNHELHMIELEFLDEPDVNQRFFRFGTDPEGMVIPLRINLGESNVN